MKVTYAMGSKPAPCCISADQVPVNTVFNGIIGSYRGIFLRAHDSVIFLEDPNITWGAKVPITEYVCRKAHLVIED